MPCPSQVYWVGIRAPGAKAVLVSPKVAGAAVGACMAATTGVGTAVAVVVGVVVAGGDAGVAVAVTGSTVAVAACAGTVAAGVAVRVGPLHALSARQRSSPITVHVDG